VRLAPPPPAVRGEQRTRPAADEASTARRIAGMKSAAATKKQQLQFSCEVRQQLSDVLRQSEHQRKQQQCDIALLNAALKKSQKHARSSDRLLLQAETAALQAHEQEGVLLRKMSAQRAVNFDLRAEVADLRDQLKVTCADAAHWRKTAVAAAEGAREGVAAAEARAEKRSARAEQKAQWRVEEAVRCQRWDEKAASQLREDRAKNQQTIKALKRRVAELEYENEVQQQRVVAEKRMKSYYKAKGVALQSALEEQIQARKQLEDDLAHANHLGHTLQQQVNDLRTELLVAVEDRDEQQVLHLLKPGSSRQFNDKAFELARALVMLGIPTKKVAPAISGMLKTLGIPVDKQPTISVSRTSQDQTKVLATAHAHSRISSAHTDCVTSVHHDASDKGGRALMTVCLSQHYINDDGDVVKQKTVLPFGQQAGGSAVEEADQVVKIIELLNAMRPDGTECLDVLGMADAVISDQASTAITVGKELGFTTLNSFPCGMHACQNQSLVLVEALDEWISQCLSVQDSDVDIPASDEVKGDDLPPSRFGVFTWEFHKLFICGRYHLSARKDFYQWLLDNGHNDAAEVLSTAPALIGKRFVMQHKLIQQMAILWPLAKEFLTKVWVSHSIAKSSTGKPNNLVANMVVYASQPWRSIAIRAGALVYSDVVSPQFYEVAYGDNQLQLGFMVRKLYAALEALSGNHELLLKRIRDGVPLISVDIFTVLSDVKASPHRAHAHQVAEAAARAPSAEAPHDQVALAVLYTLEWMVAAGKHYFRDHLESGRFHPDNTDDALKKKMRLVPAHNALAESAFATADAQFTNKSQHMSTSTASLFTMSAMNNPLSWWLGLSDEDKQLHETNAKDKSKQTLIAAKDRGDAEAARVARKARLAEDRRKVVARDHKRSTQMATALQTKLIESDEALQAAIDVVSTKKEKLSILTGQLKAYKCRFHLLFPGQKAPLGPAGKALWTYSGLGVDELVRNLCSLMCVVANVDLAAAQMPSTEPVLDKRTAQSLTSVGDQPRHSSALRKKTDGWSKQAARTATILGKGASTVDRGAKSVDSRTA